MSTTICETCGYEDPAVGHVCAETCIGCSAAVPLAEISAASRCEPCESAAAAAAARVELLDATIDAIEAAARAAGWCVSREHASTGSVYIRCDETDADDELTGRAIVARLADHDEVYPPEPGVEQYTITELYADAVDGCSSAEFIEMLHTARPRGA